MNYFMEVAKLRAARLLWARVVAGFGAKNPKSLVAADPLPDVGVEPGGAGPVYNNVARTCVEALAATLGGTQSLHTNAFDEALALPTDFSARIARNTQIYLQEETGIARVVDPWGGSFYVERLTWDLAEKAWALMQEVEAARRDGAGDRARAAEAAHRGGRGAHAGAHRQRGADGGGA
jgi:methylmalonyl-CoA mutase